jgi:HD-GYP domain-containing protein (c-di-GMP phosphodiesterase class II)
LQSTENEQIRTFLRLLEERIPGESAHAERVEVFSTATADALGVKGEDLQVVRWAAALHDVGKLALDPEVLMQHDPLSEGDLAGIREHTTVATWLLDGVPWLQPTLDGIRHHHERWDGKGYPDGLKGEEIPLIARIIAVAEIFDAIAYPQAYRPGLGEEKALEALRQGSGTRLDPQVVEAFLKVQPLIQPVVTSPS